MVPIHKTRTGVRPLSSPASPSDFMATLDTKIDGSIYHGASASLSVNNMPFKGKYTKSQIWVENGPPQELNSIQFGWAIHPELYGDTMSRFTIYWTGDGYGKTGCYNTICTGFVQDFSDLYPGKAYDPVSTYGGNQVVANLSLTQDRTTGHWWVANRGASVGYFPKELFTHLQKGANFVRYGAISSDSGDGFGAPMGNGRFPTDDLSKSAYFSSIQLVGSDFNNAPVNGENMNVNAKDQKCFQLNYRSVGPSFTYGGPGGSCPHG
ncbi:PREDICTED: uncharacterized protein LOC109116625 [Tarenaya hassleriana]|uniref:uncharacterized protein LOC109116625 n=1 Tax=Tarenaya hassleriana TaxID=28532 RepID=UPI0008FD71DD|nr:PREDICTED: uncharacterized protein LOC109116625 [Tarenaya hassleriana]